MSHFSASGDTDTPQRPRAWALSSGGKGMENQCLALAEAAGYAAYPIRLAPRAPWRWLPEKAWRLWGNVPRRLSPENQKDFASPWPDLVVACGRLSVAAAIHIKRYAGSTTFVVQCQNPRVRPTLFDLVIPPEHDRMAPADTVFPIIGAPNLALPWRLQRAGEHWRETFSALPRPLIAVAIGGSSGAYTLTDDDVDGLFAALERMRRQTGGTLAITTSRRTGAHHEARIAAHARRLGAWTAASVSGGQDAPSPILGLYALADILVVTADSVNMAAEAAATGKPVFIAPLAGGSAKFDRFHASLRARGITRPLGAEGATIDTWTYAPLAETQRAADEIRRRMAARGFKLPGFKLPSGTGGAPPASLF